MQPPHSRKKVRNLVKRKAIIVNGSVAVNSDMKINEENDVVSVNGKVVFYRKFIYLMLNKPQGYLSATLTPKSDLNIAEK